MDLEAYSIKHLIKSQRAKITQEILNEREIISGQLSNLERELFQVFKTLDQEYKKSVTEDRDSTLEFYTTAIRFQGFTFIKLLGYHQVKQVIDKFTSNINGISISEQMEFWDKHAKMQYKIAQATYQYAYTFANHTMDTNMELRIVDIINRQYEINKELSIQDRDVACGSCQVKLTMDWMDNLLFMLKVAYFTVAKTRDYTEIELLLMPST